MTDTIADIARIIANALPCPSFHSAYTVARVSVDIIDVVVVLDIVMAYGDFDANYGLTMDYLWNFWAIQIHDETNHNSTEYQNRRLLGL